MCLPCLVQELGQLEAICKQLYESTDPGVRSQAEKTLINFTESPNCLQKCQIVLERSTSSYSQLLASSSLTKLVERNSGVLTVQQKLDIRNYVLNYLGSRPKLVNYVRQALIQLLAKITKLSWFDNQKDEFVFRKITNEIKEFLKGSIEYWIIGVQILSATVSEMNHTSSCHSLTKHRKIASSFRDVALYDIFILSCSLLKEAYEKHINLQDQNQHVLMSELLQLTCNCLTFDFIGTASDESADELGAVQVPTTWRETFLNFASLQLFFDLYHALPSTLSPLALACLIQIASVRRSLFSNAERAKFLDKIVSGVKGILDAPQSLSERNNYHEFCRLLSRLKSNYQLAELVKVEGYQSLIATIAKFTVTSLQMWQFSPNSIHYLLGLWQRMVSSTPYIKSTEPHLLETYTPEISKAFITSRVDSVQVVLQDRLEDPLDDVGTITQQLEQISTIGRFEYPKTCTVLISTFDQNAQSFEKATQPGSTSTSSLPLYEGRLTWLVYIIGAVIGGRGSTHTTFEEYDGLDGELVCRVLQLMTLTDTKLSQGGCEKLEMAYLSFFDQFRKIYVGDQAQRTSKAYRIVSERLGLHDESMILSVFVSKIITNIKYWMRSDTIIPRTLQLLSDLSVGYSSVRKLQKLEAVQFILRNHTAEHFPFLGVVAGGQYTDMRCRTTFYAALGRLLSVDLGENEEKFDQFMIPLTVTYGTVTSRILSGDPNGLQVDETKRILVGICRDLTGLALALTCKASYMMLFDWIYPRFTPVLIRALELWYHDPNVTTPVLKLMAELMQNRSQRLHFGVSSPNGILLFRECCKVMVAYGCPILTISDVPADRAYALKFKGVSICFNMLKSALSGGYVNFGVFALYGDDALDNSLNMFVKLAYSVPRKDILDYPKLSHAYYNLVEVVTQDHMGFVGKLQPNIFLFILSTISDGLVALDSMVSTSCCATLDNIVSYIFKLLSKRNKQVAQRTQSENALCLTTLEHNSDVLQQLLSTLLNIIMFEDCKNQWSMSRPLLGLILLNEKYFTELEQTLVASQSINKQQTMVECFKALMLNVERSLSGKNRDRFTQNLSVFRRDITNLSKNPTVSALNSNGLNDMMS
ncbi:exportin-7-like isoform X2 [Xenia sp. Carnegie-2017]|uniref:exportin-7-like isoform X2 n=1 Tax=Xenia sp. Carnegie-2017 TaxID=2897299 RepID=UPI001F040D34|nr:exportin-7-like isoform X2 [Xenia sp. Carnegie-2017]